MTMKVEFDPKLVWKVEEEAELCGMSVSEFIAGVLESWFKPRHSTSPAVGEETARRVAELHAEGFTDEEIADRVGRVREHVARVRRKQGLKVNRKRVERSA